MKKVKKKNRLKQEEESVEKYLKQVEASLPPELLEKLKKGKIGLRLLSKEDLHEALDNMYDAMMAMYRGDSIIVGKDAEEHATSILQSFNKKQVGFAVGTIFLVLLEAESYVLSRFRRMQRQIRRANKRRKENEGKK